MLEKATFIWLLPLLPLFGALLNLAFGPALERRGHTAVIHAIAIAAVSLSFVAAGGATVVLSRLPEQEALGQILWNFVREGPVRADIGLSFDRLTAVMSLVITGVGALIHIYSAAYMKGERGYWRYFFALNLFVFAMLMLVLADNLVLMFLGWEGVGVCSYLLIGFWFEDRRKAKAALKAFIVNRIGDAAFVVGLLLLFWAIGGSWQVASSKNIVHEARWQRVDSSYDLADEQSYVYVPHQQVDERRRPTFRFDLLKAQLAQLDIGAREDLQSRSWRGVPLLVLVGLLLFTGAAAKSAQIPLYVWLPDAMAGPTPVSALIHAATMVTAGVYLVVRLSFLFTLHPVVMTTIATVGAATAVFAAVIALAQTDLKRVLAYSTVSQLGLMFLGAGVGAFSASIFHLVTHAFFKACLFLAAGSVIVGCHHEQDMRRMGGLRKAMPLTHAGYLYACIAISGLPLASGFFSKDELLLGAASAGGNVLNGFGPALLGAGLLASLLTSFYMWRSYFLTFGGAYRGDAAHAPKESPRAMTFVVLILSASTALATLLGFPTDEHGQGRLERWLAPVLSPASDWVAQKSAALPPAQSALVVVAAIAVAVLGLAFAFILYGRRSPLFGRERAGLRRAAVEGFYVDALYRILVVTPTRLLAQGLSQFDRIFIDGLVAAIAHATRTLARADDAFDRVVVDGMVNGVAATLSAAGRRLRALQTGQLQHYIYAAVAGAIVVIGLNLLLRR